MGPLSSQLSGVILKYDVCGNHLDGREKTLDKDLELKKFENAGVTFAEIWSDLVIDDYLVSAEYIKNLNLTMLGTQLMYENLSIVRK